VSNTRTLIRVSRCNKTRHGKRFERFDLCNPSDRLDMIAVAVHMSPDQVMAWLDMGYHLETTAATYHAIDGAGSK